jgi:hypothetical protein
MGQLATSEQVFNLVDYYAENLESGRALSVLMPYMGWEHSSQLIDHGGELSEEIWLNDIQCKPSRKVIKKHMLDYLSHAWELVNKRTREATVEALEHYQVWLHLMGEEALSDAMTSFGKHDYGATELAILCQHFNWSYRGMDRRLRLVS